MNMAAPTKIDRRDWRRGAGRAVVPVVLLLVLVLSACTTVLLRAPVPENELESAAPYGIELEGGVLREWGDAIGKSSADEILLKWSTQLRRVHAEEIAAGGPIRETSLALSGGGPDGAFGAGLLNGWTARGDRPEFNLVTGISTGAILALFAYLGPEYDETLKQIYTSYRTDQLVQATIFAGLTGGTALTDTRGYRRLIELYVDDAVVERLAAEHRRGRALLIGTTNIDASRPVVWNIGGIAASGHPKARTLIHDVIQASSAIPVAFPPVLVPVVTADGKRYDEMHVDGGATNQVIYFSPEFPMRRIDREVGVRFDRTIYIVINNKLIRPYNPVRPRLSSIAGAAVSSLISGSGGGDLYRIFAITERDDIGFNLVWIPREFDKEPQEPFDPVYMQALFELGYEYGLAGDRWVSKPPDFDPGP